MVLFVHLHIKVSSCSLQVPLRIYIPSEFSIIRGEAPSITATAELVVPRSIPITWPLTLSSAPSAYVLTKDEPSGDLMAAGRLNAVARGKNWS